MTDYTPNFEADAQNWVTGGAGEGEPALSLSDIRANIEAEMSLIGNVVYSESELPETARERPVEFLYPGEIIEYLAKGSLMIWDNSQPKGYQPNPLINIQVWLDPDDPTYQIYSLWIDDETP